MQYACETWTYCENCEKKAGLFEMWCYLRMFKIPCTDIINNTIVLAQMEEENTILVDNIKKRKSYQSKVKYKEN